MNGHFGAMRTAAAVLIVEYRVVWSSIATRKHREVKIPTPPPQATRSIKLPFVVRKTVVTVVIKTAVYYRDRTLL